MRPGFPRAEYLKSAHRLDQLVDDTGLEVAFAGRSNCGKSSTINRLTSQKGLARTSKTPGRTQQMVLFDLGDDRRLVDLPGYGYAKVPPKLKAHWGQVMDRYFTERQSLAGVILIMDIRHPLKPFDEQMLAYSEAAGLPIHAVLNKADKLSRGAAKQAGQTVQAAMRKINPRSTASVHSALKGDGSGELAEVVMAWLELLPNEASS